MWSKWQDACNVGVIRMRGSATPVFDVSLMCCTCTCTSLIAPGKLSTWTLSSVHPAPCPHSDTTQREISSPHVRTRFYSICCISLREWCRSHVYKRCVCVCVCVVLACAWHVAVVHVRWLCVMEYIPYIAWHGLHVYASHVYASPCHI